MSVPEEIYSGIENKVTIKHGYVKMKSRQLGGFWKKRYIVLYSPSSMGPSRLVKYNDKNDANRGEKCLSEIMMADVGTVVRMASEDSKHGITLNMPTEVRQFLCDDEVDCCDWLQKLKAETGKMDVLPQGVFRVFLIPSAQLNYSGECCLHIHSEMFLLSENPDKSDPIVEWNIKYIRRYAVDESKKLLKIENGRRQLVTGEGLFILRTIQYDQIKALLDTQSRRLSQSSTNSDSMHGFSTEPRPSLTAAQVPVRRGQQSIPNH